MLTIRRVCFRFSQLNRYQVLGVNQNVSMDAIKEKYLELAKLYHPDVNPLGQQRYNIIKESFDILSNKQARLKHDKQLGFDSDWRLKSKMNSSNFINNNEEYDSLLREGRQKKVFRFHDEIVSIFRQNSNRPEPNTKELLTPFGVPLGLLSLYWFLWNVFQTVNQANQQKKSIQAQKGMVGGTQVRFSPYNIA